MHVHVYNYTCIIILSSSQNPCDRNILEELSSGQLQCGALPTPQAPPTQQAATPTEPEFGDEIDTVEDFDLDDDLNLDDLDLNTDVSLPQSHSHSSIKKHYCWILLFMAVGVVSTLSVLTFVTLFMQFSTFYIIMHVHCTCTARAVCRQQVSGLSYREYQCNPSCL